MTDRAAFTQLKEEGEEAHDGSSVDQLDRHHNDLRKFTVGSGYRWKSLSKKTLLISLIVGGWIQK